MLHDLHVQHALSRLTSLGALTNSTSKLDGVIPSYLGIYRIVCYGVY